MSTKPSATLCTNRSRSLFNCGHYPQQLWGCNLYFWWIRREVWSSTGDSVILLLNCRKMTTCISHLHFTGKIIKHFMWTYRLRLFRNAKLTPSGRLLDCVHGLTQNAITGAATLTRTIRTWVWNRNVRNWILCFASVSSRDWRSIFCHGGFKNGELDGIFGAYRPVQFFLTLYAGWDFPVMQYVGQNGSKDARTDIFRSEFCSMMYILCMQTTSWKTRFTNWICP